MKVESDMSSSATKTELKNETRVDTSSFAKNIDLANWKSDVDKLDTDKLKNVPSDFSSLKSKVDKLDVEKLSKLFDAVKIMLLKKMYIMLRLKILNNIPDITDLATNASLNAKINEVNGEIPIITNLATTAAHTTLLLLLKTKYPMLVI